MKLNAYFFVSPILPPEPVPYFSVKFFKKKRDGSSFHWSNIHFEAHKHLSELKLQQWLTYKSMAKAQICTSLIVTLQTSSFVLFSSEKIN